MGKVALQVIDAAHEGCRDINGYCVATASGEFRIFGWAANKRLAKKLAADVRRNPSQYAFAGAV